MGTRTNYRNQCEFRAIDTTGNLLINYGNRVTIIGVDNSSGGDTIDNRSGGYATIRPGKGQDVILANPDLPQVYIVNHSEGTTKIWGYKKQDKIILNSGIVDGSVRGEEDINFYFDRSTLETGNSYQSTLTLKYANKVSSINIVDGDGKTCTVDTKNSRRSQIIDDRELMYGGYKIECSSHGDKVCVRGQDVTIYGGTGNDSIEIYGMGDIVSLRGGSNYVYSNITGQEQERIPFNKEDTLVVDGGNRATLYHDKAIIEGYGASSTITTINGNQQERWARLFTEVGSGMTLVSATNFPTSANNDIMAMITDSTVRQTVRTAAVRHDLLGPGFTIVGGSGNDTMKIYGSRGSIDCVGGNNYISGSLKNSVIMGGSGNDTIDFSIHSRMNKIYHRGNELVLGYKSGDTVCTSSALRSTARSGDGKSVIATFADSKKMTLMGVGGTSLSSSTNINIKQV